LNVYVYTIAEFYQLPFTLRKLWYKVINRGHCQKSLRATFCRTVYITALRYIQGDTPNILSTIGLYLLILYSVIVKWHKYAKALYRHSRNIAISRSRHLHQAKWLRSWTEVQKKATNLIFADNRVIFKSLSIKRGLWQTDRRTDGRTPLIRLFCVWTEHAANTILSFVGST